VTELIFHVEEAPEGGFVARALGASIFTQGDDVADLERNVLEAVRCHFDEEERPRMVRLHFTREEVLAV
jgi:predicted RNase H-like HicB family nuclease